ncbi:MAG: hypothetical protein VX223_11220 [Myxococcota bacterium]|nr:hypothetical protein [Myxococcota bacterium]
MYFRVFCVAILTFVVSYGCSDASNAPGIRVIQDTQSSTAEPDGECQKDTDCPDGFFCFSNECVNPNSSGTDSADGSEGVDSGTADSGTSNDDSAGGSEGTSNADGSDGASSGQDGSDAASGSSAGQGSGAQCQSSSDCPGDEICCDLGFGGYCEADASACYGPECSNDAQCGADRECCPEQGGLPAYCAPVGGCYGPTCGSDGDCSSNQECCPIDFLDNICGPIGQCIGNLCTSDADCEGAAECCAVEVVGQQFSVCLLSGLCALAQNAAGGGDGGDDGSGGFDSGDGSNGGSGTNSEYSCAGICGEFKQGWPCQCTEFCNFVPGGCCDDYEPVCEGAADGNDGSGSVTGCESSDECGNFAICCPQGNGTNACQAICQCTTGADCVDGGCCTTGFGAACVPEEFCFGGTFDPASP